MPDLKRIFTDEITAKSLLPKRQKDSNKGSFGKALLITGSEKYEGAGRLSLEAALRGGCGIVSYVCSQKMRERLIADFPEAIYYPLLDNTEQEIEKILFVANNHSSVLIGSGSGNTRELYRLTAALLENEGCPLILDADAINSLSVYGSAELIKRSRRLVVLTPHALEFSRLSGISVEKINGNRERLAVEFSKENNCVLLLKGNGTVITDGNTVYINTTGNSALSKGGSGDVLAGLLVSLLSFMNSPLEAAALSAFLHGRAGDRLSKIYSEFGVTPSDLPKEIARCIRNLEC